MKNADSIVIASKYCIVTRSLIAKFDKHAICQSGLTGS